ncbi:magnetosome protein MamD [Terasakiella sp. SH-1]|uniref:magnetosome protein MamD n=1 Tax=Terasakiella sp. SH-1 TaxID=2560057 RepID=UPI001073F1C7|nr:magnetosome protein MamD [Terasakiella sp. SH-1]
MLLLKAEQARSVPALVGKTWKVGEVTKAGGGAKGLTNWLVLHPAGSGAGSKTVMVKVTGAGQQLPSLVGKTFTFGKSPVLGNAGMKYMALYPAKAGSAAAGAAAAGTKGTVAVKLANTKAAAQLQAFQGKAFVIGKAPVMGNNLANNMLVLEPLKGAGVKTGAAAAAKGGAAASKGLMIGKTTIGSAGVVTKGAAAAAPVAIIGADAAGNAAATTVAKTAATKAVATKAVATKAAAATAGKAAAGKAAAASAGAAAAGTAASGTIWTGTGLSLGLGLGLGALGPVLLTAAAATGGYFLYKRNKDAEECEAEELDATEALINPPAPSGNVAPA